MGNMTQKMDAVRHRCSHSKSYMSPLTIRAMFTYIHNWPLQPFSHYYDLITHITYIVCVNFLHNWWDLQFKVDSERQIFEQIFMAHSFCQKFAERKLPKK